MPGRGRYDRAVLVRARRRMAGVVLAVSALVLSSVSAVAPAAAAPARAPVILFPAFHLTRLSVTVHNQTTAPECPRSGRFEDWYRNSHPSRTFNQVCQDRLLTLRYDGDSAKPMPSRFSNQRGVDVRVKNYGRTDSAPLYEPMYRRLESAGYVRNKSIRVAGYDGRLTPDMDHFVARTKKLIEDTYHANGDRPVHLVGHSNGPLYAQYVLTHTTRAWRARFIHGFTPLAGNMPGQGMLYPVLFTGLNVQNFGLPATPRNAASSSRLYRSAPTTYMSAADPEVFGNREVVLRDTSTGRSYTPRRYRQLLRDAKLPVAREIANYYIGFVKFADPRSFPHVDVYAERGSGLPTVVGASLPNLKTGQVAGSTRFLTRDGDGNQEDITNLAISVWRSTPCYRFKLTDNPGVNHFLLPSDRRVLDRLLANVKRSPSHCPA